SAQRESHGMRGATVPITDKARNHLYNTLREKLGAEDAVTMRELLPPVGWADVARRSDLEGMERRLDARMERLEDRMDRFEAVIREQTRFFVTVLVATMAAMTGIFGLIVHL